MPNNKNKAQNEAKSTLKSDFADSVPEKKIEPEKTLFSWTSPARPFKRRDREFWITIAAIVAISGLILFLVEGFMPVILIISIVFLFYILNTVEPENIEYKITNKGIRIADKMNNWDTLGRFWFTKRFNSDLLVFETTSLTGRLELVINPQDKKKIKENLTKYSVEEEAAPLLP